MAEHLVGEVFEPVDLDNPLIDLLAVREFRRPFIAPGSSTTENWISFANCRITSSDSSMP